MKKLIMLIMTIMYCIVVVGCSEIESNIEYNTVIEPDFPFKIGEVSFESIPKTIASLSPAITEIINELGHGDKLVARSSYCDYPQSVVNLLDIGSSADPSVEEIIRLAPEMLISQSPIAKKDITKIEKNGIKVLILSTPKSIVDVYDCYKDIASILNGKSNADEIADSILSPLLELINAEREKMPSFAYIMTYELAVATGDTLAGDVLSYFGKNIAAENQKYIVTAEQLVEKNPELIFLAAPMNAANLSSSISGLTALQQNTVIPVDNLCFERPTARRLMEFVEYILPLTGGGEPPLAY